MRDLLLEVRAQIVQMLLGSSDEEITLRAIAGGMPECLLEIANIRIFTGVANCARTPPMLFPVEPLPWWLSRSSTTTLRQPALVS